MICILIAVQSLLAGKMFLKGYLGVVHPASKIARLEMGSYTSEEYFYDAAKIVRTNIKELMRERDECYISRDHFSNAYFNQLTVLGSYQAGDSEAQREYRLFVREHKISVFKKWLIDLLVLILVVGQLSAPFLILLLTKNVLLSAIAYCIVTVFTALVGHYTADTSKARLESQKDVVDILFTEEELNEPRVKESVEEYYKLHEATSKEEEEPAMPPLKLLGVVVRVLVAELPYLILLGYLLSIG